MRYFSTKSVRILRCSTSLYWSYRSRSALVSKKFFTVLSSFNSAISCISLSIYEYKSSYYFFVHCSYYVNYYYSNSFSFLVYSNSTEKLSRKFFILSISYSKIKISSFFSDSNVLTKIS